MFSIKIAITFVLFFITFGLLGVVLDIFTRGRFNIRQNLTTGADVATQRARYWIAAVRRGWLFSPIFALLVALSPLLFTFALIVFLVDCYSGKDVVYSTTNADRLVLNWSDINDDDLIGAKKSVAFLPSFWPRVRAKRDFVGTLYPATITPIHALTANELNIRKAGGWRKLTVDGEDYVALPDTVPVTKEDEPE